MTLPSDARESRQAPASGKIFPERQQTPTLEF
jgi:hypothetical protein